MIFPENVRKGDLVGIIAPSSPTPPDRVKKCRAFLESEGYRVKEGRGIYENQHGYIAGPCEDRLRDIHDMFSDPRVKAIFCLRGGDTSCYVVDKLDMNLIRANPKIFMGYSDITSYHVRMNQEADLITFHGPMVSSNMLENFDAFTRRSLEEALALGENGHMRLENPEGEPFRTLRPGRAEGALAGGNLALICSMLGTPYAVDTRDKILFIEDVGESTAHVDRMLHQLMHTGKLQDAAGVLVGDFSEQSNKHDPSYLVEQLIGDFFADYDKPVIYNVLSGHCYPMSTLPLGARCRMGASDEPSIEFFAP